MRGYSPSHPACPHLQAFTALLASTPPTAITAQQRLSLQTLPKPMPPHLPANPCRRRALLHHFSFKGPVSIAKFSPDGRYLAAGIGRLVQVSGGQLVPARGRERRWQGLQLQLVSRGTIGSGLRDSGLPRLLGYTAICLQFALLVLISNTHCAFIPAGLAHPSSSLAA